MSMYMVHCNLGSIYYKQIFCINIQVGAELGADVGDEVWEVGANVGEIVGSNEGLPVLEHDIDTWMCKEYEWSVHNLSIDPDLYNLMRYVAFLSSL